MDSATAPYCQECDQKDAQIRRLRGALEKALPLVERASIYMAAQVRAALQEPIC